MKAAMVLALIVGSNEARANELWQVTSMDGKPVASGQEATIELSLDRMSGKSFCNRYSVAIQMKNGTRIVGEAASTRMACAPPLMVLENRFLGMIKPSSTVSIRSGELIIQAADGGVIRARRK